MGAVRLEVGKEHIDERVLALLYEVLEVKDEDVYIMDGPIRFNMFVFFI